MVDAGAAGPADVDRTDGPAKMNTRPFIFAACLLLSATAQAQSLLDAKWMVEATPAGRAALREVYDRAITPIAEALDSLTVTQHQKLSDGLSLLRDAFADAPPEREVESPQTGSSVNRKR